MSLKELVDNTRTDKNTVHSYLDIYQTLFADKQTTATHVLEIGIYLGGSIKLWSDFFQNANVYGLDCMNLQDGWEGIRHNEEIQLLTSIDAYDEPFFSKEFLDTNLQFDLVLDDGPHTLESMQKFIRMYSQILKEDGILVIEDIQEWEWIDILKQHVPEHLQKCVQVYDIRSEKNRYDDILFVIDKRIK